MARITSVKKSRKECKCGKCGIALPVGSAYKWAKPMNRGKIIRCMSCGLQGWETSGSAFVHTVAPLQQNWQDTYGMEESDVEEIKSELETLRDECEESKENMPESLQEGPTGELLQERVDNLEEAIDQLDGIDFESPVDTDFDDDEEYESAKETYEDELIAAIQEALDCIEY